MAYGLTPIKSEALGNDEWEIELMNDYEVEEAMSKREDVSAADKKRAEKKYGNVTYADPKNKKYPIDTEEHIRAAWNYIGQKKNQAKYSASEVAAIKNRIVAAWKAKIDKSGPPSAQKSKSEAIMDENEVLEQEPVAEEEQVVEEEIKEEEPVAEEVAPVEENELDKSAVAVVKKVQELAKAGRFGAAALKEIQPMFNEFGKNIEKSLSAPAGQIDEDALAEKVAAKLLPAFQEMMAKSLAGVAVPQQVQKSGETIVRSLTVNTPTPIVNTEGGKKLSQIEKISNASMGLPH